MHQAPGKDRPVRIAVLCQTDHTAGPYGIDRLPGLGFTVEGPRPLTAALARKVRDVVEHRVHRGVDLPLRGLGHAARSDLVLGLLEPVSELALQLKSRGVPPYRTRPFVLLSCWLAEWLQQATPQRRRALVRTFSAAGLILTLSTNQVEILVDAGFTPDRVAAIPFGCEPSHFTPRPEAERDLDVVAAGFDHGRDYATFLDGVRDLDVTVHLLCQPANLEGITLPANTVVHGVLPYDRYRQVLERAKVVAVPTQELAYPSGQSVALDAAAAGAAVAFTGTRALGEYFDDAVGAPVPVGDGEAWGRVVDGLLADDGRRSALAASGRARVLGQYTNAYMWAAFRDAVTARDLVPGDAHAGRWRGSR